MNSFSVNSSYGSLFSFYVYSLFIFIPGSIIITNSVTCHDAIYIPFEAPQANTQRGPPDDMTDGAPDRLALFCKK